MKLGVEPWVIEVVCPRCGTRPNLRVLPAMLDIMHGAPADSEVMTWRCPRCREVALITARAIQRARPLTRVLRRA